ncbi:uncharacterized protein m [Bemisia tabaci]|uniref:uncharacterized protein m n=1 Tax=Bemisia tabaci TaxID=7038 RepID=UPI003B2874DB
MPVIQSLEVMCGKDHMDVHLQFTQPFEGIVSSKGQYGDPRCVYVPPSSGKTFFSFRIAYARCGTKPDLNGQFYENTVVIQYDKDLLEVWDEAKRLRCEWYNDYEKTASKPPMVIADLDVIQLDFRGDNVDCWMEIQHGKGPWAPPVSGIVPLGSTLTLVVAINDYRGEFDMRVKSCAASDGGGHVIELSDEHGCVLRPKMISRFLKARINDERASVITYAFFHAFKFPDALSVHIKCKVEICRHGCLDHCQLPGAGTGAAEHGPPNPQFSIDHSLYGPLDRKDSVGATGGSSVSPAPQPPSVTQVTPGFSQSRDKTPSVSISWPWRNLCYNNTKFPLDEVTMRLQHLIFALTAMTTLTSKPPIKVDLDPDNSASPSSDSGSLGSLGDLIYDEMVNVGAENDNAQEEYPFKDAQAQAQQQKAETRPRPNEAPRPSAEAHTKPESEAQARPSENDAASHWPYHDGAPPRQSTRDAQERFPHGPRTFDADTESLTGHSLGAGAHHRRRRSVVVSDRKARNADVGVSGLYEVISEADLAFTPDSKAEAVTVFQGRIREDIVYGICLPVPSFSALFMLVSVSAVASALIAGSLLYRYQVAREAQRIVAAQRLRAPPAPAPASAAHSPGLMMTSLANLMSFRINRPRIQSSRTPSRPSSAATRCG